MQRKVGGREEGRERKRSRGEERERERLVPNNQVGKNENTYS